MVLCTQVNKMYVIATLSVCPHRASIRNPGQASKGRTLASIFQVARCG